MRPLRWQIFLHLLLVYVSWGSTYIGLKLTLEVLGPFSACGLRMFLGGLIFCLWLAATGQWRRPHAADLRHAAAFGICMVVMASGFLTVGQRSIDSGVAAVVSGSTPITMLLAAWLCAGEERPALPQWLGLLGGMAGLAMLGMGGGDGLRADPWGMAWVLAGTFGWVAGSLRMRSRPFATALSPRQSCALLLLAGGLECLVLSVLCGEAALAHPENLRPETLLAFSWMVVGGAILAYNSYFWLLAHVSIATAVSYEYVVPVIGILLGWLLGGEPLTGRMLLASCLSIGSVFLVIWHRHNR